MLRVVDVIAKTTVQQSARMLVAEIPGEIQSSEPRQQNLCKLFTSTKELIERLMTTSDKWTSRRCRETTY
ncbi:hypothetical protein KIN20_025427 [Parelaphostrongylus tenuis]|uniref:Uncharacterized protein n=1 Tax=Parelaphostrongylus tenuis TaxID=148309 RepID=A0AAD5NAS4_PARTN|nr:hypothetical protein KIN20_025427 [Parelaphostrongylus tenuis]